jgi:hypothetical protein
VHANKVRHTSMGSVQPCDDLDDMEYVETSSIEGVDIESLQREIEAAESHRQRITHGLVHLPDGKVQITEEMDLLHWIDHMEKTAKRIASTKGPAIKQIKVPFAKGRFKYVLTPLGEAIWTTCCETVPLIEQMYPGCRKPARVKCEQEVPEGMRPEFNPQITVALHACQIALPALRWCAGHFPDLSQEMVRRSMEHLLCSVRRVCRSRRFKYQENNYRRNAKKCFRSSCDYMAALFAENARLLILRVDLYFLPDHKEWADTVAAGRSISRFLRALRESRVLPDLKGWAARRENGFRRGIHVHVLVAMDGHKHREAASWSQVLGETWVNKYSDGHGSYFNCYTRKDWFKFNGLGLVHISNLVKLMGVREALRYITKSDFHIATGYEKNFWKGQVRHPEETKKRGAPRKTGNGMTLVNSILGKH